MASYDPRPLIKISNDVPALDKIRNRIALEAMSALKDANMAILQDISQEHGLSFEDAALVVARLTAEATDFLRWVRAGELRAADAPIRAIVAGLGYSSNTSVQRQLGTESAPGQIRRAEAASRKAAATGEPQDVVDDTDSWRFSVDPPVGI